MLAGKSGRATNAGHPDIGSVRGGPGAGRGGAPGPLVLGHRRPPGGQGEAPGGAGAGAARRPRGGHGRSRGNAPRRRRWCARSPRRRARRRRGELPGPRRGLPRGGRADDAHRARRPPGPARGGGRRLLRGGRARAAAGDGPAPGVRREQGGRHRGRDRRAAGRGAPHPDHPARHTPRAAAARPGLRVPRLLLQPLGGRPPHRAPGGRGRHRAVEPVATPPPAARTRSQHCARTASIPRSRPAAAPSRRRSSGSLVTTRSPRSIAPTTTAASTTSALPATPHNRPTARARASSRTSTWQPRRSRESWACGPPRQTWASTAAGTVGLRPAVST